MIGGQRRVNEDQKMGLPLSTDETFMSQIKTEPGLNDAIASLVHTGELGIVTVGSGGMITQAAGVLADWAHVGAAVEDNAPWLTGLGDRLSAIGLGVAPPLRLEHIAVLDDQGRQDRVVSLNAVPCASSGATLLVLRDATHTAALQREVLQQRNALALAQAEVQAAKDAAEAASRAKSDFLAKVNHELRTPLHVVLGNAELLADASLGFDEAARADLAADLLSEGQYLLGLIDDLLDLSRAEAGAPLLELEDIRIEALLEECVAAISAQPYAADIGFEISPKNTGIQVRADRRALRQIAANLLSNAAKFSPAGARVTAAIDQNDEGIWLTFTDGGPGLTEPQIAQALEHFGQADNQSHSRAPRGAGVGLPLVKALAEAHGGDLCLSSAPGEGLIAVVRLPNR